MMDCNEKWSVCNKKGDFEFIMNTFGVTASTARLLINRDKTTEEGIREFLYPDEDNLHPGTLMRNLKEAADYGCTIVPPMLTFYNGADTVEKQIDHIVGKVLGQFGLNYDKFVPWRSDLVQRS
jgi:4-hydroxy-3-polyprenylbenzoate decarboxylase